MHFRIGFRSELQWGAGLKEIGQIGYLFEIRILAKFGDFFDNFGL